MHVLVRAGQHLRALHHVSGDAPRLRPACRSFAFAVMQISGTIARIVVGWIADRARAHLMVLALLGVGSSANIFLIGLMDKSWGGLAVLAVSAATGFLAASWNGVLLSEIARLSPPARVGETSSAATFFIFLGYVTGPALFALVIHWTGSYPLAFRRADAAAVARRRDAVPEPHKS